MDKRENNTQEPTRRFLMQNESCKKVKTLTLAE